jgi:hypothetical protein
MNEKCHIIYIDELYILYPHVQQKSWNDSSLNKLLTSVSTNQFLIIIHAGGENGFISHGLVMWKSYQAARNYHQNMNQENYKKWVKERLIPNVSAKSVTTITTLK